MQHHGIDRRVFPRANYPCLIIVAKGEAKGAIMTHTENISIGGVRVIINKKLEESARVELRIDLMDTEPEICCRGDVAWIKECRNKSTKPDAPARYDTGIKFTNLQTQPQERIRNVVERLLAKIKQAQK